MATALNLKNITISMKYLLILCITFSSCRYSTYYATSLNTTEYNLRLTKKELKTYCKDTTVTKYMKQLKKYQYK